MLLMAPVLDIPPLLPSSVQGSFPQNRTPRLIYLLPDGAAFRTTVDLVAIGYLYSTQSVPEPLSATVSLPPAPTPRP